MHWRRAGLIICLLLAGAGLGYWRWNIWLEQSQDRPIRAAARRYGLEPALVKAVVWRESHFNAAARGRVGELGLMQLQAAAAQEWADAERVQGFAHLHCLDAGTNTMAGTWYLKKLLKRYSRTDSPLRYALADYNAGRHNVLKWSTGSATTNSAAFVQQIQFPSTRGYVEAVLRRYEHYRPIFRGDSDS